MSEEQLFLAALDQPDASARAVYLDETCGVDTGLRRQVEALLATHFRSGEFLDVPAVEQIQAGSTGDNTITLQGDSMASDRNADDGLHFLTPSTRPDSLGRLGHYEVLQVLGKGGFGIVFRAFDDVLQRVVAVKVMAPEIATLSPARKRFVREARSSAAVRHENVVQVYEVGEQPLPYLVMEFIPGETLQQKLDRNGPLAVTEVLQIGRQIAEGLTAAHATDLIHRDIKPANVLIEGGTQHRVKITDFGLARAADDASISQSGIIAGTPMFMAPEQAQGQPLDQRADLFSLGSVLYQMASGRAPFRANNMVAVLKRVAEDTPRPIREIIPETPQWLCAIISKLHAKNPDDRYQSAREVADVLADCEAQLKAHSKVKDLSRIPRGKTSSTGRRKWIAAAPAIVMLAVFGVYALITFGVHALTEQVGPDRPPTPLEPVTSSPAPAADGWVQLFNGKDLTGWKTHPLSANPTDWSVEDGAIVGRGHGTTAFLFTEASGYENFHLRADVKVNETGDAGIFYRVPFDLRPQNTATKVFVPGGYEAQIAVRANWAVHTGSVLDQGKDVLQHAPQLGHRPNEWFVLELIAEDNRLRTKVNGKVTADYRDDARRYTRGHLALQSWGNGITVTQFRKIEIKEMPADPVAAPGALPPTFKNTIGMEFAIVPKGKSWLGGGKDKLGDKEVVIPADFYLGKYEVAQEEWERLMPGHRSHFSRMGEGKDAVKDIPDADLKRFPVERVSWEDCQLFVEKLNKLEKETGWVYRLPTEAEWEYACRGGPMSDKMDSAFDFYFAKPTNTLLPEQANFNAGLNRTSRACYVLSLAKLAMRRSNSPANATQCQPASVSVRRS